jgi:Tfp pilus assembly protein PilW
MSAPRRDERGLTLTELTVAMVVAAMVVMGIVGFYMNSQATWFEASSKAITQREGTLVLETVERLARRASAASVVWPGGDSTQSYLYLTVPDSAGTHSYCFWWQDSLIHEGFDPVSNDSGPIHAQAKAARFVVSADTALVRIRDLRMVSPQGQIVTLATSVAMKNR